jgi:DNA-binding LacI/PurR family transcriptional regulator
MELLPKRTNLVDETALVLKEWISTGLLSEELPGELQLKARLGVGRDTLRRALLLLTKEGWLQPAEQGRQRRVQIGHPPAQTEATRHLPVTFLSPYPVVQRLTVLEMEATREGLAEQGRALHFISPRIYHLKHPQRHLERLVREHPSAAWVLHIASEPLQRWFDQRGLPTLLFDSPFPGVRLPFVADDWEAAAFHAGLQLIRQGHRIVGILEYQERRPGLLAVERGLQRALAAATPPGRVAVFKDNMDAASVARSLELAFDRHERPTALVLSRAPQVLTCFSWLASRGIRTPGDVSLVSVADESWFDEIHPPLSHYRADARLKGRHIADRVLELVTVGHVSKKSVRLPREHIPGATIGPAPPA